MCFRLEEHKTYTQCCIDFDREIDSKNVKIFYRFIVRSYNIYCHAPERKTSSVNRIFDFQETVAGVNIQMNVNGVHDIVV